MQLHLTLPSKVDATAANVRAAEAAGYEAVWVGETKQDPFLQSLQAINASERIGVGTSIAIAFARTPMTVASAGYDLAGYAKGRFVLGLGSQVKPHIERRFSMPWSHPAPRMREFVQALRAIWACWQDGAELKFEGRFYTHTLMTPFFMPVPHEYGPPPVYLAGVGEIMTEVVGEVADGWFFHPFTTQRYLRDITLPSLERGRRRAGRPLDDLVITGPAFIATGRDDAELDAAIRGTKKQIAFYASTPSYRPVLEHHGWADLGVDLTALSRAGKWDEMTDLVHDDLLHAVAVVGTPSEAGLAIRERWGDVATAVTLYANYESDPAIWPVVAAAVRG